jgi:hypothetical protein
MQRVLSRLLIRVGITSTYKTCFRLHTRAGLPLALLNPAYDCCRLDDNRSISRVKKITLSIARRGRHIIACCMADSVLFLFTASEYRIKQAPDTIYELSE